MAEDGGLEDGVTHSRFSANGGLDDLWWKTCDEQVDDMMACDGWHGWHVMSSRSKQVRVMTGWHVMTGCHASTGGHIKTGRHVNFDFMAGLFDHPGLSKTSKTMRGRCQNDAGAAPVL